MPKKSPPPTEPDADSTASGSTAPNETPTAETPSAEPTGAPTGAPTPPLAGNRFFAWMRSLALTREPGWVGGVCAGIAVRLGVDPLLVRGVFVVVAVLGGPAFLLYAAAWLLLPDRADKIHLEEVFKGRLESPVAGIGALVLLSMLPITQGFWFAGNAFWGQPYWGESVGRALWTLVVLGAIVWFVVWVARRSGREPVAPTTTAFAAASAPASTTETVPATADVEAEIAAELAAELAAATGPTERPVAPAATASAEEFAAWKAQQAQWKAENAAFRAQKSSEQRAASLAAQEQYRVERAARREIERARHARTRSNPLYSAIAIGLSLVIGGVATVAIGDGVIEPAAILAGLGATLGVLGLAIIVNGARGKRPGGAQGLAAVVLIPILVAAVLPHSPRISYTEDATFVPLPESQYTSDNYYVGVGDTVIDLRELYDAPAEEPGEDEYPFSNVALFSGIGDVTVLVPEGVWLSYGISVGNGSIDGASRGSFETEWSSFGSRPEEGSTDRSVYLNVTVGTGDVTFERTPAPITATTEGAGE